MGKMLSTALAVFFTLTCCLADDPEQLKMAIYRCPPVFFIVATETDQGTKRTPSGGVKKADPSPFYESGNVYDVLGFFTSQGIDSPEGAQAFLIERDGLLFVRNTIENLELIQAMGPGGDFYGPMLLRNEIFVVQFSAKSRNPDKPAPTLAELRKAAGDSWKQLCSMEVISKSGQAVRAANSTGTVSQEQIDRGPLQAPEMQISDTGAVCAVETMLGPDSYTIESNLAFRYQSQNAENEMPRTIAFSGSSVFWDGQTQVLQFFDGSETGTAYAVLMRVTVVAPNFMPRNSTSNQSGLPENK